MEAIHPLIIAKARHKLDRIRPRRLDVTGEHCGGGEAILVPTQTKGCEVSNT